MELVKDLIRQFYPVLIMTSTVLFVVYIFFSIQIYGGKGVMEGAGQLFSPTLATGAIINNGLDYLENSNVGVMPEVRYIGGIRTVGDILIFKELFEMSEDDSEIYLLDIKNGDGASALVKMSMEEIAGLEYIPAPFIYEKDLDMLFYFASGSYTVSIKVYGIDGCQEIYEFTMPVETA